MVWPGLEKTQISISSKNKVVKTPPYSSYNRYFLIPFILWMIAGGLALIINDKESLFKMVNTNHAPLLDTFVPFITMMGEGLVITVILVVLLAIPAFQNWWYVTAAVACTVLPSLATQVIKRLINAERPLTYFKKAEWVRILPGWEQDFYNGFPSGHSCGAFAMFCLLACLLPLKYRPLGILLFVLALSVAYSRLYLSAHFFADVYVGSLIGVLFAVFILSLLRKHRSKFFKKKPELT